MSKKPEISDDMRKVVAGFMLSAGLVPGDRVPYDQVKDMLERLGMSIRPKRRPGTLFGVDGIVSAHDQQPYVVLSWENEPLVQLDVPQARQVAMDIVQVSARTEADAGIVSLLEGMDLDRERIGAFLHSLRDYRKRQDDKPTAEPRVS